MRTAPRIIAAVAAGFLAATAGVSPASADQVRDKQWHLGYLKASELHAISKGGGVTVGVVDSGVDGNHPDLAGNVLPGVDLTVAGGGKGLTDTNGHGTAMASLIAARGHGPSGGDGVLGLAPGARVVTVRSSVEQVGTLDRIAAGIRWAADHDAKVINVSQVSFKIAEVCEAVTYAQSRDAVVVAGLGNLEQIARAQAPARCQGVVAVSGIKEGGEPWEGSTTGKEAVVAAPAHNLMLAKPGGGYWTSPGTSGATALVSGAVALIRAKFPKLDAKNVVNRLIKTADDKGARGRDERYGFGIINPLKALTADVPTIDHDPLGPSPAPTKAKAATNTKAKTDNTKVAAITVIAVSGTLAALAIGFVVIMALRTRRRR